VKPNINLVEVHPQLSHKGHMVDGVLMGAKKLFWVNFCHLGELKFENGDKKCVF
jgi:hypothetical protein